MKNAKFIPLIIVFLSTSMTTFAQRSIDVVIPGKNTTWYKTKSYTIQWWPMGYTDRNVKIRLFNKAGTVKILSIIDSTGNGGKFHWTIPGTVPTGEYRIRVKTLNNKFYDDSEVFKISDPPTGAAYLPKKIAPKLSRPSNIQKKNIPDFFIDSISISPDTRYGLTVTKRAHFYAAIKNTTPTTTPTVKGELKKYRDSKLVTFEYIVIKPIRPFEIYTYGHDFDLVQSGDWRIEINIDTTNLVRNEIESNNSKSIKYTIEPLRRYITPKNITVILNHTLGRGDKDFAGHGPEVSFRGVIYITKDGSRLEFRYWMIARETKSDWTAGNASGLEILHSIGGYKYAAIASFSGGYTKVVYNYRFTFGTPKTGSKDLHGQTIDPDPMESIGEGTKNPMKVIYFMGNHPKKKDDIGYCGFEITFNKIEIVQDRVTTRKW